MQLINGTSSELQKLLKYINAIGFTVFFRIPLAWFGASWAIEFSNNLTLYLKDLKLLVLAVSALKVVVSSLG